jgi:hypothetical protein
MGHGFANDMHREEAAEFLGITEDEALTLPIPWSVGPDGDIWYARADVVELEAQGWRPWANATEPEDAADAEDEEPEDA